MGLRKALTLLPDDRHTDGVVRDVLGFFSDHPGESLRCTRIARALGREESEVVTVIRVLASERVLDCDGDPGSGPCSYRPDTVLSLEVVRHLRTACGSSAKLQRGVDRFRSRYGPRY